MDKSTYVTVNGTRISDVFDISSTIKRDFSLENGGLAVTTSAITATIQRAIYPTGPYDGLRIKGLGKFTLKIHTPRAVSTFSGCEWISFEERVEENRVVEKMTIAAASYAIE